MRRLTGAVRSGHPAVFLSLVLRVLRPILSPVDRALGRLRRRAPFADGLPRAALMVSPPRSGSTVIFQVITRALPCVYPSNFHFVLPRIAGSFR